MYLFYVENKRFVSFTSGALKIIRMSLIKIWRLHFFLVYLVASNFKFKSNFFHDTKSILKFNVFS